MKSKMSALLLMLAISWFPSFSTAAPDLTGQWNRVKVRDVRNGSFRIAGRVLVQNRGDVATSRSLVCYFLSNDPYFDTKDELISTLPLRVVRPGKSLFHYFRENYPDDPSGKYLIVLIDPEDSVAESNEQNNEASILVPTPIR